jgi:hypothetical protein
MTKQKILSIFGLMILLVLIVNVSALDRTLFIKDYEIYYSYFDAEEGEKFTLTITITNTGSENKTDVVFELDNKGPLDVDSEDKWEIGDLSIGESVTSTFRIEVDDDTPEGKYEMDFILEDSEDDFEDEIEIEVESDQADLIIGDVRSHPTTISPDEEDLKLEIVVENVGSGDATFVRARLILPEGFTASNSYSDIINLGTIVGAGKEDEDNDKYSSKTAVFFIDTDEDLESGIKKGELELEYKSDIERKVSNLDFDLPVKGKPLFSILSSSTTPNKVMQGETGKLNIKIENIGEEEGMETSIRVFENSDLPLEFDAKTNFIGNLKSKTTGNAVFDFEVDEDANPKEYLIKVQVRTLNNDNVIVSEYSLPLKILKSEENNFSIILIGILIVVILIIIFMIYRRRKRRRSLSEEF